MGVLRVLKGSFLPFLLILLWHVSVTSGWIPNSLVPTPSEALSAFVRMLRNSELITHSGVSLFRLLLGFLIGAASALIIGMLVGISRSAEDTINPTLSFLAPIPPIAWIPLLIILFGIGDGSKISLLAIGTFFIVFTSVFKSIRGVQQKWVELAELYEKKPLEILRHILIPAAMTEVFLSARVALALSWILLIAAEVIASSQGLGWLIWDARNFSRPDDMVAGMIAIGILGKVTDQLLIFLERKMVPWKNSFRGL